MTPAPITVNGSDRLLEAVRHMAARDVGAVLVLEDGKLVGIFTERDLLRFFARFTLSDIEHSIDAFMTRNPVCANKYDDFDAVFMKMKVNCVRHIPILENDELVGIVSMRDLTHAYEHQIESDLADARHEISDLEELTGVTTNEEIRTLMHRVKELEKVSVTDHLTGLYNARYFEIRLDEEVARALRYKSNFSLVFCDIDLFKSINDTYGHPCGDEVLKEIGRVLNDMIEGMNVVSRLRKSDIVARYGGEEFVMILPETHKEAAVVAIERVRRGLAAHRFECGEDEFHVTMSFGVAEFLEDAKNATDLILKADQAMYRAKHDGRNRVVAYDSDYTLNRPEPSIETSDKL